MKILVLGNGFMGNPLARYLEADTSTKRLNEITKEDLAPFDIVINTVAKTAIDWCEKNKEEALETNAIQATRIAKIIRPETLYIFISSGCIFKSNSQDEINYEDSVPNPQCFYSYTKCVAEQLIMEVRPETLIIRPRLILSEKSHPRNTINKLLKYDKIITCQESATVMEDMFIWLKDILIKGQTQKKHLTGIFNVFNEGTISPSEIAQVFNHPHTRITKMELDEMTKGMARRVSTILGTKQTIPLPNIWERLQQIKDNWE